MTTEADPPAVEGVVAEKPATEKDIDTVRKPDTTQEPMSNAQKPATGETTAETLDPPEPQEAVPKSMATASAGNSDEGDDGGLFDRRAGFTGFIRRIFRARVHFALTAATR